MLSATNLSCIRGDRQLFDGLGFALNPGEWLHVSGENGTGKTSLLRMLCGLSAPATGEISWRGKPIHAVADEYRSALAYVGHQTPVKEELSARENLQVSAAVKGWNPAPGDADSALTRLGLGGRENLPVRYLSQGQKRRVALAQLLCGGCALWILDEPLVALDGDAVAVVTRMIEAQLDNGGIVVLTSHQEVALPVKSKRALHIAG